MNRTLQILGVALAVGASWTSPSFAASGTLTVPGEEHCVVNVKATDPLNLRSGPKISAPVLTTKKLGTCGIVVVEACQNGWCPAEDGHYKGWVSERFISMVSPARYCVTGVAPGDKLNLRAYPSSQSQVLHRLDRNQCEIAFLPYATKGWQKVRVDGREGWVNGKFLSGQ
jgi:SH3-like domain-containing protein